MIHNQSINIHLLHSRRISTADNDKKCENIHTTIMLKSNQASSLLQRRNRCAKSRYMDISAL